MTAFLASGSAVDVEEGRRYISEFVSLLEVPVYVNGTPASGHNAETIVPLPPVSWRGQSVESVGRMRAQIDFVVSQNGTVWIHLDDISWSEREITGSMMLRSETPGLRTYRNGFGLATVGVATAYQFGGVVDLMELYPTAGREALTSSSMQFLQSMLADVAEVVSRILSCRPECDSSTAFMNWVVSRSRYELCDRLRIGMEAEERVELGMIRNDKEREYRTYAGTDRELIKQLSSDESPLLMFARYDPRRRCEREYIERFCKDHVSPVSDQTTGKRRYCRVRVYEIVRTCNFYSEFNQFSATTIYCLRRYGLADSHIEWPVYAEEMWTGSVVITIDRSLSAIEVIVGLYENEYSAFGPMVGDFVRNVVYPRISRYVPNSQVEGTEAFLQMIRRRREAFEYEDTDILEFPELAFWDDVRDDRMAVAEAIEKTMAVSRRDVQVLDSASAAKMEDVLPDVAANQVALRDTGNGEELTLEALPAITRSDVSCSAKLLTIPIGECGLAGYRCFLALGRKAREDRAEFFLGPHTTSIVWGGQRVLFIFTHPSGEYGLYYDLESRTVISSEPGGGRFPSCTIFLANQVYIPIPLDIQACFLPKEAERKRFLVRDDLLSVGIGAEV